MSEVTITEADVPAAPGKGARKGNPTARTAANLGVKTERYQCVFPAHHLAAIDAACEKVKARRSWVMRAAVRQLVEEGEIVTDDGRVMVHEHLGRE